MNRFVMVALVAGCAGQPPASSGGDPGAGTDAPPSLGKRISGKAIDYFTAGAVAGSTITTDGIDPPATATSLADGSWEINDVPLGSTVVLSVAHSGYRTTRNLGIAIASGDVVQDAFELSEADVIDQYNAISALPTAGRAVLVAEMRTDTGPLEGIPLANVRLVDAQNQPVANVQGPVFFGATAVDPNLTMATAFAGRSRVAILDIPPGVYTLKVTFSNAQQVPVTTIASVTAIADGAVLALTQP